MVSEFAHESVPKISTDSPIFSEGVLTGLLREPFLRNSLSDIYDLYDAMEGIIKSEEDGSKDGNGSNKLEMQIVSSAKSELKQHATLGKASKEQPNSNRQRAFDGEVPLDSTILNFHYRDFAHNFDFLFIQFFLSATNPYFEPLFIFYNLAKQVQEN